MLLASVCHPGESSTQMYPDYVATKDWSRAITQASSASRAMVAASCERFAMPVLVLGYKGNLRL